MRNRVARVNVRAGLLLLLLAASAAACASATKRYEQGLELEQAGRPADAAARYIAALKRDPSLADARMRLRETGDLAVQEYLAEARAADAAGSPGDAADLLLRMDALRGEAQTVGVALTVPADYADVRRATMDRAIEAAVRESRAGLAGGGWNDALRRLDRAAERWQPTPAQRRELDAARLDAFVAWGESEAARGRYRAAHDVAERALRMLGPGHPDAGRALALQADALRRGTVRVAVLPLAASSAIGRQVGDDVVPEVNDLLIEGPLMQPPLFIDVIDPAQVTRDVRRHGYARQAVSPREAARVARAWDADLVVIAEVDSAANREDDLRETRRAVRTRAGTDTAYTVQQGRRTGFVRIGYSIVDVRDGRVLESATVDAEASHRFRRGVYAGDPRTLTIPREDRDLFDAEAERREQREFVNRLAAAATERFARHAFDRLQRRVN
jgi:tetratricopeptide (TPR) repeat protein